MSEHLPLLNPPASSFIMPPHETQAKEEANVRSGLSTTMQIAHFQEPHENTQEHSELVNKSAVRPSGGVAGSFTHRLSY